MATGGKVYYYYNNETCIMAICSSLFLLTLFLLFFSQAPFTTRKSGGLSPGELGKREDNVLFILRLVLFSLCAIHFTF
jgi:hypothetical protein